MQDAVILSMSALVKPELLRHQDKDLRLIVVNCISENHTENVSASMQTIMSLV